MMTTMSRVISSSVICESSLTLGLICGICLAWFLGSTWATGHSVGLLQRGFESDARVCIASRRLVGWGPVNFSQET